MPSEFKITRQVDFGDTDAAGVVYFANYFRFMEACESAFFRSLGLNLSEEHSAPRMGWPRVSARCDYREPLRFGDTFEVRLFIKEIKPKAISYVFRFTKRVPDGAPVLAAEGEVTAVCVTFNPDTRKMTSSEIPAAVLAKIQAAPPSALAQ